ncbi:hypothetical protein LMG26685_01014 [Achromobacter mucicolens]|uniref:hypothetical protein n=1 Tax=Achromobacter mucicolens TaxID=1389922 RepID=UPI0009CEAB44|nr:hypothetical protein [Achromobacter mucicolens]OXC90519.1 hypothetical protein BMR85_012130 [Achromobacter sp. KAs 3-5]CAB3632534.1 hypothetical protein LMG26685_01014 [Achromobacter mucicolens]
MWRRFFKMTLAVGWLLWLAAMAWFAVGMVRYAQSADATLTPIVLTPGQTARAEVYRIREAPLWMEARFGGPRGRDRPELGDSATRIGAADGKPRSVNPGEPVRIRVRDGKGLDLVVSAAPLSAASATHFYRKLWPETHANGAQLQTAPGYPKLAKGASTLTFTVEEAGPALQGEQIELEISAPIGLKRTAGGWDDVATFIFWPFIAAILGAWALVWAALTWWYRRRSRRTAL